MVYRRSEGGSSLSPSPRDRAPSTPQSQPQNAFRNDGSFLEMFKRMQEANTSRNTAAGEESKEPQISPSKVPIKTEEVIPTPPLTHSIACSSAISGNCNSGDEASKDSVKRAPLIGKRRGGRILPTGMVKKKRTEEEGDGGEKPKDAWSLYMAEVRRYKETSCEEDGKTRPLVK